MMEDDARARGAYLMAIGKVRLAVTAILCFAKVDVSRYWLLMMIVFFSADWWLEVVVAI